MNDDLRKKADEYFKQQVQAGGVRTDKPSEAKLSFAGVDDRSLLGDNFCDVAPKAIKTAEGLISTFGWLIPDKVEGILKAVLKTMETVVLPAFCGTAAAASFSGGSAETTQKKG